MRYKIPFIKPIFPDAKEIIEDYKDIVESNHFTNFGPYEKKLSSEVAKYVGDKVYATTIANCTLGIEVVVNALFDEKKEKVIMPSFTFAAGAEVLIKSGFQPVFIDIEKDSWQPSILQAEKFIKANRADIAGILLCNIFGVGNKNIQYWEALAKLNKLPIIIDTAAGFGSEYSPNEKVGARGDCEVFSLHATKPFAVGEGGLITSTNQGLIEKIRSLQNFGFDKDRVVRNLGTNAKLQELNCAIGLRQLAKLDNILSTRREVLRKLKDRLIPHGFDFQINDELSTVPFASVATRNSKDADNIYKNLIHHGVEARRYYSPPLHKQLLLRKYSHLVGKMSVTESLSSRIISVPVIQDMNSREIDYIANIIIGSKKG